jgi:hypothetical protein
MPFRIEKKREGGYKMMKMEKTPEQSTIRDNSHHCPHERQGIYENRQPDEVVLFAFLLSGNNTSAE